MRTECQQPPLHFRRSELSLNIMCIDYIISISSGKCTVIVPRQSAPGRRKRNCLTCCEWPHRVTLTEWMALNAAGRYRKQHASDSACKFVRENNGSAMRVVCPFIARVFRLLSPPPPLFAKLSHMGSGGGRSTRGRKTFPPFYHQN